MGRACVCGRVNCQRHIGSSEWAKYAAKFPERSRFSRLNKVVVYQSAPDPAAVAYFRDRIPDDALLIRYEPHGRAVAI